MADPTTPAFDPPPQHSQQTHRHKQMKFLQERLFQSRACCESGAS